jgi:hypothetical protein
MNGACRRSKSNAQTPPTVNSPRRFAAIMPHANTAEDHARRPRGSGTPGCSRMVASRRRPAPPPLRVSTCQIPSRASHYDLHDGPVCLCLAAAPWRAGLSCCQGAEERGGAQASAPVKPGGCTLTCTRHGLATAIHGCTPSWPSPVVHHKVSMILQNHVEKNTSLLQPIRTSSTCVGSGSALGQPAGSRIFGVRPGRSGSGYDGSHLQDEEAMPLPHDLPSRCGLPSHPPAARRLHRVPDVGESRAQPRRARLPQRQQGAVPHGPCAGHAAARGTDRGFAEPGPRGARVKHEASRLLEDVHLRQTRHPLLSFEISKSGACNGGTGDAGHDQGRAVGLLTSPSLTRYTQSAGSPSR